MYTIDSLSVTPVKSPSLHFTQEDGMRRFGIRPRKVSGVLHEVAEVTEHGFPGLIIFLFQDIMGGALNKLHD